MVFPHTFGVTMPAPDLAHTGCILLWGHNPSATWLALATRVADAKARGAKLVVVDPRHAGFAVKADQWLRVRPGSDGALALGIAGVMIAKEWFDRAFVQRWTNGPLLVREDTGRFLSGSDLNEQGDTHQRIAWDRIRAAPIFYDSLAGAYERSDIDLALSGRYEIPGSHGSVICRPAFDLYASLCQRFSPDRVEQITWVPAAQVRETARVIASSGPVSFYSWAGLEMHTNASQTNRAIALLYALTGSFDAEGGNAVFEKVPTNDVTGVDLMSEPTRAKALGLCARPLGPESRGWITTDALYNAILDHQPYAVRGLVNFGKNLLFSHADGRRGARALGALEFMVHADLFINPTAEHADILLPVSTAWEHEGLCTDFMVNQEASGHVQLRPAVIEPRGEARSDTWIAFALAERLGLGDRFWNGDLDSAYRHLLSPSGIDLADLRQRPGGLSSSLSARYRKYTEGTEDKPLGFNTPSKKVEIYSEVFLDHGYTPLPDYVEPMFGAESHLGNTTTYPLVLTSAKSPHFLQSQSRGLPSLRKLEPDPLVEINPATAIERRIADGDWVALVTPRGRIRVRARFSNKLHPGVVSALHGWWQACEALSLPGYEVSGAMGANLNALISNDAVDPIGGSVPHKSYRCQIERLWQL
jgi:anaerobic selenocysteine-containing dehydrogenase